jgi:hypothetical protein
MGVNVSDNRKAALFAELPQFAKVTPVEADNAGFKTSWIKVVIEDKLSDPCASFTAIAEQESTTFVLAIASVSLR